MDLGKDTFKWIGFIFELFRLFVKWFGNEDDQNELESNGLNNRTP